MKQRLVLCDTRDHNLDRVLTEPSSELGVVVYSPMASGLLVGEIEGRNKKAPRVNHRSLEKRELE
jgi:aryl-alcohol dehydrogenase-like predicted oxidoreductase